MQSSNVRTYRELFDQSPKETKSMLYDIFLRGADSITKACMKGGLLSEFPYFEYAGRKSYSPDTHYVHTVGDESGTDFTFHLKYALQFLTSIANVMCYQRLETDVFFDPMHDGSDTLVTKDNSTLQCAVGVKVLIDEAMRHPEDKVSDLSFIGVLHCLLRETIHMRILRIICKKDPLIDNSDDMMLCLDEMEIKQQFWNWYHFTWCDREPEVQAWVYANDSIVSFCTENMPEWDSAYIEDMLEAFLKECMSDDEECSEECDGNDEDI